MIHLAAKPKRSLLQSEVAVSRMMTFITTIPDPDELLTKAGIKRYQLRQLELDDEVAQAIDTRREAVVATPYRIEPNQTRVGKLITSLIEPHVEDLKRGTLDSRFYGYSVMEIIYKQDVKAIGIDRLSLKPMQWFQPNQNGSLSYFPDDGSGGTEGILCDPIKFLLSRCNASYQNPFGEALLSRLWFPVTWRREGWSMWLSFLETFGEPIILGMVRDYKAFVEAMVAQGVRSTVAWESVSGDDKAQAISASTPGEFERLENAILRRIQKLILGQTLTSDVGSNGSYAVAAIHNEVRNDKRRADMRMVQTTGQQLVNNLCLINGIKDVPKFVMADDAGLETARAQRDSILAPILKISGLQLTREYFEKNFDYEIDDIEEGVIQTSGNSDPNDPNEEDETSDPLGVKESTNDTGEKKPAVKDRSVVDQGKMLSEMIQLELKSHRSEPSVIHLTNEINLPEGMVKSDPVQIQFSQEPNPPVQVNVTLPELPPAVINLQSSIIPAPIVNMTLPEQPAPEINIQQPDIRLTLPESPVNITVLAPEVTVTPEIKVHLGTRQTVTEIERDRDGLITKTSQIESDVSGVDQ